jgi:ribosomal protein L7/L12
MSSETDLVDHARRLAQLEAKVAELERRVAGSDADATAAAQEASGFTFASDTRGAGALDDPRIVEAVGKGNKIEAIKLYRELTGVGLAEAKSAIDSL